MSFLRILQGAKMEEKTMWRTIKNIGIRTNTGENRALLVSPGRNMRDWEVYKEACDVVDKYAKDDQELHFRKGIAKWLGVVNVFIA